MGSNSEKGSSDSSWLKLVGVVISLLTVILNYQTSISNEKLQELQKAQEEQKLLLEKQNQILNQQRLLLEQQNADFHVNLNLFDRAITSVAANNQRQLEILLALVQSLPKSDYSNALLSILSKSSNPNIQEQAINSRVKAQLSEENSEWVYKPYSEATARFTDYKIFTCNSAGSDLTTEKLLISTLQVFDAAQRTGTIRVKKWQNTSEFTYTDLQQKITVITDKNHPEKQQAERIVKELKNKVKDIPPVDYQDERGKSSSWQVSIVLCP